MPLNNTGPISLAGSTAGQSIAVELGQSATGQISLNDANVRSLAGVPSGAIVMPTNFYGKSAGIPFGCATYTTAGTYSFVVPTGATKICVVCIGGGQGGGATFNCCDCNVAGGGGYGGSLAYTNCIPTTPGETLTVVVGAGGAAACTYNSSGAVGASSSIARGATILVRGSGALSGVANVGAVSYGGGNGGYSCFTSNQNAGGGGGAAGYAGVGGNGGAYNTIAGSAGAGGGGGGGAKSSAENTNAGGGGGTGLIVQGSNGAGGASAGVGGGGGSGGTAGSNAPNGAGGAYGGGGAGRGGFGAGGGTTRVGQRGGVRIIYGGTSKTYPNNSAP